MKIHLHQIPAGETLHLEGHEDAAFLELQLAGATAVSPLEYSLDAGLSEGGIFASGYLFLQIQLRCVACLEVFEQELRIDPFVLQKELGTEELVDLSPEIREEIQLAVPAYPRCDGEGSRVCPASFPTSPADDVSLPAGPAAWGDLDKLKPKD
ncbi:MAG: hypothetical protein WCQ57_00985 [Verrucomicrobiota bacterium]